MHRAKDLPESLLEGVARLEGLVGQSVRQIENFLEGVKSLQEFSGFTSKRQSVCLFWGFRRREIFLA
jgi:hypothetical protein